jgi:hypothetical protein
VPNVHDARLDIEIMRFGNNKTKAVCGKKRIPGFYGQTLKRVFFPFFDVSVETNQNEKWVIHMRARHSAMLFILVPLEHTHKKKGIVDIFTFFWGFFYEALGQ